MPGSALRNFLRSAEDAELCVGQQVYLAGPPAQKYGSGPYLLTAMAASGDHTATPGEKAAVRLLRVNSLEPVAFEYPAFAIECQASDIQAHAGARFPKAIGNHLVGKYIEWVCKRANRPKLYDPAKDYDKLFRGLAMRYTHGKGTRVPEEDLNDMIIDVLHQVITPQTVKAADENADLIKYFGGMFIKRMITAAKSWKLKNVDRRQYRPNSDTRTDEDWLDSHAPAVTQLDQETKELFTGLYEYLSKKPEAKYYKVLLPMMFTGHMSREVAEKLGVHDSAVNRYLTRMKGEILNYAKQTGNDLLYALMQKQMTNRKHSLTTAGNFITDFPALLKEYKKMRKTHSYVRSHEARKPSGEVSTVRITSMPDVMDENYLGRLVLSDKVSQQRIDTAANEFLDLQAGQDDLIEDGNRIYGLSVDSTETRGKR